MKKLISLGRASFFLMMLSLVMMTSCDKPDFAPNNPNPIPTAPGAPFLNASLSRDTAWFNGTETCSFTSDGVVKHNGITVVTNPITFTNITTPVAIALTATIKDPVTGLVSPTTSWNKTIQVYSENKTNICRSVVWKIDSTMKSNELVSPTENPTSYTHYTSLESNMLFEYFTNNIKKTTMLSGPNAGLSSNSHYHFENNDSKLWLGPGVGGTRNIESTTSNRMVLTLLNQVFDLSTGQPVVPAAYVLHKFIYKRQ